MEGARSLSPGVNYKSNKNKEKTFTTVGFISFFFFTFMKPCWVAQSNKTTKLQKASPRSARPPSRRPELKKEKNKLLTQGEDPRLLYKVALVHNPKQQAGAAKNMISIMNYTYFPQTLWVCYIGLRLRHII